MKLRASAARLLRAGWRAIVEERRAEVERALADSPSLRRELADLVARGTMAARRLRIWRSKARRPKGSRASRSASLTWSDESEAGADPAKPSGGWL